MPDQNQNWNQKSTEVLVDPPHGSHPAKKNRSWVWVLLVIILGAGAYFYLRQSKERTSSAQAQPAPRAVPVSTAAVRKGDIGVYINALGTVTPVYTDTITSRVQGEIVNVYYREGQMVHKGDPLLDIDSRPYQAALTQVEGQLAHDQALLNEAKIDLDRYQSAYQQNAIAKQQVDDQEQTVFQYEGTVKNDEGPGREREGKSRLLPYYLADRRPRWPSAGGSRQYCPGQQHDGPGRGYPTAADHRDFFRGRGLSAADPAAIAQAVTAWPWTRSTATSRRSSPPDRF